MGLIEGGGRGGGAGRGGAVVGDPFPTHLKGFWKEAPSYSWSYVKFSLYFTDKKKKKFFSQPLFQAPFH